MKRNYTLLLIVAAWLILPTGDPSDFIVTTALIDMVGGTNYAIIAGILIYFLYKYIKGKTIQQKLKTVNKEVRRLF